MNLREAKKWTKAQLKIVYEEGESEAVAGLILHCFLPQNEAAAFLAKEQPLTEEQILALKEIVKKVLLQEPVQYVLQQAHFYGMDLYVNKDVLIPRPETEELVDWIVKDVKASGKKVFDDYLTQADATTELKVLDIGTGSGCIALAVKQALPKAEVWGCDSSDEALNVARRNGAELNIRVDFQRLNILDEADHKAIPTCHIIVSNPPYIPLAEKETLSQNVVEYEPHTALFVPTDDALLFYKAIVRFAQKRLYPNGAIYLEIHENFGEDVVALFEREGYKATLKKDMQGKNRMVKAVRGETPVLKGVLGRS